MYGIFTYIGVVPEGSVWGGSPMTYIARVWDSLATSLNSFPSR